MSQFEVGPSEPGKTSVGYQAAPGISGSREAKGITMSYHSTCLVKDAVFSLIMLECMATC